MFGIDVMLTWNTQSNRGGAFLALFGLGWGAVPVCLTLFLIHKT